MPIDYKKYPIDWKDIVKLQKIRAGDRCELCGVPNKETVYRDEFGIWFSLRPEGIQTSVKIILTTHHIDGDLKNNKYPNLILVCQRCHLRLDLAKHINNKKKRRLDND
jgi:hypothetical protein